MLIAITAHTLFDGERYLEQHALVFDHKKIVDVIPIDQLDASIERVDYGRATIVPGFIDIQVNGGGGVMLNDEQSVQAIETIIKAHRQGGTAYLFPTLISEKPPTMAAALEAISQGMEQKIDGLLGIHLEGPWLNPNKKGAHDQNNFYSPTIEQLEAFPWLNNGVNFITLAPEQVDSESIKWLSDKGCIIAAGHTNLVEQDLVGKLESINGFTHLYNAMSSQTGRELGAVGVALNDDERWATFIADGIHVHPQNLLMAIKLKPKDKMVLVTDAMASVGNPDESFVLDGQTIRIKDGKLVNESGNLAGAHITLAQSVRNLIDWGVDAAHVYQMASTNPAHALNLEKELGYLKVGYRASATIINKNGEPSCVLVDGNLYSF
ncbi:N-acetylglucosamine-6-phosphate deacetylase [Vibrio vulnificus]|nr:N-acetylglucosamine-6-phosphate deacetylase [Vibrio vulnificus]EGR7966402.1 N-acetylglucosamine-6-phosphate deacetylase [Vibrio vulnificus]EHK9183618.1 N-acetylglucosamine-6-phosphate deacetylase [Vibrio vulnificus]EHK9186483.1 N-acetylglucosamine-6-phosphate deacetylase [Vibrio vulnificus]EHZ2755961.1 N-acetylglucosamine-6-phosphate deacetylase [Vibrio vulnificus]